MSLKQTHPVSLCEMFRVSYQTQDKVEQSRSAVEQDGEESRCRGDEEAHVSAHHHPKRLQDLHDRATVTESSTGELKTPRSYTCQLFMNCSCCHADRGPIRQHLLSKYIHGFMEIYYLIRSTNKCCGSYESQGKLYDMFCYKC